jgi:hypothetical protein
MFFNRADLAQVSLNGASRAETLRDNLLSLPRAASAVNSIPSNLITQPCSRPTGEIPPLGAPDRIMRMRTVCEVSRGTEELSSGNGRLGEVREVTGGAVGGNAIREFSDVVIVTSGVARLIAAAARYSSAAAFPSIPQFQTFRRISSGKSRALRSVSPFARYLSAPLCAIARDDASRVPKVKVEA